MEYRFYNLFKGQIYNPLNEFHVDHNSRPFLLGEFGVFKKLIQIPFNL